MTVEVSYAESPLPMRQDLVDAHQRAWQRLARAGTWWTGAERVAIAAEVRNAARCRACSERKSALSPAAVTTPHAAVSGLRPAALDAVHRITRDPARLTKSWYEKTLASGLSDAEYVELVGVVVTVVSIDSFCRGLGVPPHPLPEPVPGEPTRYRPATAVLEGAWTATIPAAAVGGAEADLWSPGRTGNVIRALSLVPDEVRELSQLGAAHYLPFNRMMDLRAARAIDRMQIELLAARVSALRECFY
jgi:hypothetical protein